MEEELGSAGIKMNQDFISINSKSYIRLIYDLNKWFEIDIDDDVFGCEILSACKKTYNYTIEYQSKKNIFPTNYEEWVSATKVKFGYKSDRKMFANMEYCRFCEFKNSFVVIPMMHTKLRLWERDNLNKNNDIILDKNSTPSEIGRVVKQVLKSGIR